MLFAVVGCGVKSVGIAELQSHYDQVKECMSVTEAVPAPNLRIVKGVDKVECNGFQRRGCYKSGTQTVLLPENTDETTVRHEFVHHLLYVTTGDLDSEHRSTMFLKCSGIITE